MKVIVFVLARVPGRVRSGRTATSGSPPRTSTGSRPRGWCSTATSPTAPTRPPPAGRGGPAGTSTRQPTDGRRWAFDRPPRAARKLAASTPSSSGPTAGRTTAHPSSTPGGTNCSTPAPTPPPAARRADRLPPRHPRPARPAPRLAPVDRDRPPAPAVGRAAGRVRGVRRGPDRRRRPRQRTPSRRSRGPTRRSGGSTRTTRRRGNCCTAASPPLVTAFDADLGRVFDLLRGRGLDRDAAWVLTADHGFPLGEHGVVGRSARGCTRKWSTSR